MDYIYIYMRGLNKLVILMLGLLERALADTYEIKWIYVGPNFHFKRRRWSVFVNTWRQIQQ